MSYDFTLSTELPAVPQAVFDAWLSSQGHTAMTGGTAHVSAEIGAAYDAWGGYITGKNLEIGHGRRIVQTWRTQQFSATDPDSIIEVTLEPCELGTRLTLVHKNVPDGQTSYENHGWREHYFEPMQKHFEGLRGEPAE